MIRNQVMINGLNQAPSTAWIPHLIVSPAGIHFGENGDVPGDPEIATIDVADVSQVWAWSSSETWCSVSGASLLGDDTATILCSSQPSGEQPMRYATITFTSTSCPDRTISIIQDARAG